MQLNNFYSMLKRHKVPVNFLPHAEPEEALSVYSLGSITRKRLFKSRPAQLFRVTKEFQEKTFTHLCYKKIEPYIIGLSSLPTDLLAIELASLIHYKLHCRSRPSWEWIDVTKPKKIDKDELPKIVVFYNITPNSDHRTVRTLINSFRNSLRLVVVAGADALTYFDDYLYMSLTSVIHCVGLASVRHPVGIKIHKDETRFPLLLPEVNNLLSEIKKRGNK